MSEATVMLMSVGKNSSSNLAALSIQFLITFNFEIILAKI
jgi:hypothetical protein